MIRIAQRWFNEKVDGRFLVSADCLLPSRRSTYGWSNLLARFGIMDNPVPTTKQVTIFELPEESRFTQAVQFFAEAEF